MRGTGRACTRGRSVGLVERADAVREPLDQRRQRETIATADRKPQTTVPSRIRASRESGKDMARICRRAAERARGGRMAEPGRLDGRRPC